MNDYVSYRRRRSAFQSCLVNKIPADVELDLRTANTAEPKAIVFAFGAVAVLGGHSGFRDLRGSNPHGRIRRWPDRRIRVSNALALGVSTAVVDEAGSAVGRCLTELNRLNHRQLHRGAIDVIPFRQFRQDVV